MEKTITRLEEQVAGRTDCTEDDDEFAKKMEMRQAKRLQEYYSRFGVDSYPIAETMFQSLLEGMCWGATFQQVREVDDFDPPEYKYTRMAEAKRNAVVTDTRDTHATMEDLYALKVDRYWDEDEEGNPRYSRPSFDTSKPTKKPSFGRMNKRDLFNWLRMSRQHLAWGAESRDLIDKIVRPNDVSRKYLLDLCERVWLVIS